MGKKDRGKKGDDDLDDE